MHPTGITANRDLAELIISWDDGHTSIYPFSIVRAACPCAECRGGHENMRAVPDDEVFQGAFRRQTRNPAAQCGSGGRIRHRY